MITDIHRLQGRTLWFAVLLLALSAAASRAQAPVAVNDDVVITGSNPVTFDPLDNDSDPNDLPITISAVAQPSLGNVVWTDTSVTYYPNLNYRSFAGSDTFSYTITDGVYSASAEVVVGNPFYLEKGNFAGTLNNPGGGYLTLSTTATGGFTGKLRLGRRAYSLTGSFASDGTYSASIGGEPLALQFDVTDLAGLTYGAYSITGTYNSVAFTLYHALYNSTSNPAPQSGTYTLLLPPSIPTGTSVPTGTGFATMTVAESGNVTITGNLADGTAFSDGVYITGGTDSYSSAFPLYAPLAYTAPGSLIGSVTFEDIPGVSDCDGSVTWLKPTQSGGTIYPGGFSTSLTAIGSRYVEPPLGTLALNLAASDPNANISLTAPDFPVPLFHQLYVKHASSPATDTVVVVNGGPDSLTLSINAGMGTFSGTFIHPVTGKRVTIKGALLHKQNRAAGFFIGPTQSGNASIWP
jgi:hypothetical protein